MQNRVNLNSINHISHEVQVVPYNNQVKKEQYVPLTMNALSLIAEKGLNACSVILYTLLADRSKSSSVNGFIDEDGKPYIYYTISEAMKILKASANSIRKYFAELCELKLIEFKDEEGVAGYRKVRRIYVNQLERVPEAKLEAVTVIEETVKQTTIDEAEMMAIRDLIPDDVALETFSEINLKNDTLILPVEEEKQEKLEYHSGANMDSQIEAKKQRLEHNATIQQKYHSVDRKKNFINGMKSYIKEKSIYRQLQNIKLSLRNETIGNKDLQDLENYIANKINYAQLLEDYSPNLVDYVLNLMVSLFKNSYSTYFINKKSVDIQTIREEILKLEEEHIRYLLYSLQRTTTDVNYIDNYFIASLYSINENLALDRRGYFNYLAK